MTHAIAGEGLTGSGAAFHQHLEYSPHQLVSVRMLVRAQLRLWNREALVPDAWVVVTELCSNVRHTGQRHFELTLCPLESGVRIEVKDRSRVVPQIPTEPPGPHEANGRGLLLVRAHAERVGTRPTEDGKVMWAECGTAASPQPTG